MGLLDDAIREHLDLKRRRGADPTEVEQAEREALGPVRRGSFEHAADEPDQSVATGAPAYDQAAEPELDEGYEAPEEDSHDWGDAFEEEGPAAAEPHDEAVAPVPAEPEPAPPAPVESHGEPTPPPPDVPETAEYDVEDAFAGEEAEPPRAEEAPAPEEPHPGQEDVLEETPEFLQDAPEHDRLWFEQRPPRDFDFDG